MAKVPVTKSQLLEQLAELNQLREEIRQAEASNLKKIQTRFKDRPEQKPINTRRVSSSPTVLRRSGGLLSIAGVLDSEIVDPLARAQQLDQPARLLATTGPGL